MTTEAAQIKGTEPNNSSPTRRRRLKILSGILMNAFFLAAPIPSQAIIESFQHSPAAIIQTGIMPSRIPYEGECEVTQPGNPDLNSVYEVVNEYMVPKDAYQNEIGQIDDNLRNNDKNNITIKVSQSDGRNKKVTYTGTMAGIDDNSEFLLPDKYPSKICVTDTNITEPIHVNAYQTALDEGFNCNQLSSTEGNNVQKNITQRLGNSNAQTHVRLVVPRLIAQRSNVNGYVLAYEGLRQNTPLGMEDGGYVCLKVGTEQQSNNTNDPYPNRTATAAQYQLEGFQCATSLNGENNIPRTLAAYFGDYRPVTEVMAIIGPNGETLYKGPTTKSNPDWFAAIVGSRVSTVTSAEDGTELCRAIK